LLLLRSEIPSGMCAKLRTVAESNNRDHASQSLLPLLARATHIHFCYSRTSRSWCITQSTQGHRRGCNNIPSFLLRTTPIARSLCEGWTRHDLHILVTAPLCWRVSLWKHVSSIGESDSLCPLKWLRCYTGSRLLETRSRQGIWEVTLYNLLPSTLASHLITLNGNVYRPLAQTATCRYHHEETKNAENGRSVSPTTTRSRHYSERRSMQNSARS